MRLSIERHNRAIKKLRLERALLLDALVRQTSDKASESDKSSSPPPTVRSPQEKTVDPQEKPTRTKRKPKQATPQTDGPTAANTSPANPARSTPVATTENAGSATFIPYSQPADSSPPPAANGQSASGGAKLPSTQAQDGDEAQTTYENGSAATGAGGTAGASEDVSMSEDGPSFAGGFTAVNRS